MTIYTSSSIYQSVIWNLHSLDGKVTIGPYCMVYSMLPISLHLYCYIWETMDDIKTKVIYVLWMYIYHTYTLGYCHLRFIKHMLHIAKLSSDCNFRFYVEWCELLCIELKWFKCVKFIFDGYISYRKKGSFFNGWEFIVTSVGIGERPLNTFTYLVQLGAVHKLGNAELGHGEVLHNVTGERRVQRNATHFIQKCRKKVLNERFGEVKNQILSPKEICKPSSQFGLSQSSYHMYVETRKVRQPRT